MSDLRTWLDAALQDCRLDRTTANTLLGRGVKPSTSQALGLTTWVVPATPSPDQTTIFKPDDRGYGARGERFEGRLVTPIRSARGELVGVEFRDTKRKIIHQCLVPEAQWNPIMIGLAHAMPALWAKGAVWVVEGIFDLAALDWVVPSTDGVVATIRARVSDAHVELFRRLRVPMVNLVYDNDPTGRTQTAKGLYALRRAGVPCRDVKYCGGKDPGVIWETGGLPALQLAFGQVTAQQS